MQVLKINVDSNMRETTKHGSYDLPIAQYIQITLIYLKMVI